MGPLKNPRHEKFVQALFEGKAARAAYQEAGYRWHTGNCIRLKEHPRVQARLAELQTEAAKAAEVSVQSLLGELEAARAKATSLDQLSAAVRAIEAKARISGLMVQRVEQTITVQNRYEEAATATDVYKMLAQDLADDVALNEQELVEAAAMVDDFAKRMNAFVETCRFRSLNAPSHNQRQIELVRSNKGNGSSRRIS